MSKNHKRGPLPWLAAGTCLVMVCVVFAEIRARPTIHDAPAFQATAVEGLPAPPTPSGQAMPEKNSLEAIVERPLFSSSRRPHSEQTSVASVASGPSLDLSLFGVVISPDEAVALVKPGAGGGPMRVKQGEEISGWTVARIEPDRILVRRDVMERELLLDFKAPVPPAEPAVPMEAQAARQGGVQADWQPNEGEDDEQSPEPTPPSETDAAIDQLSAN